MAFLFSIAVNNHLRKLYFHFSSEKKPKKPKNPPPKNNKARGKEWRQWEKKSKCLVRRLFSQRSYIVQHDKYTCHGLLISHSYYCPWMQQSCECSTCPSFRMFRNLVRGLQLILTWESAMCSWTERLHLRQPNQKYWHGMLLALQTIQCDR